MNLVKNYLLVVTCLLFVTTAHAFEKAGFQISIEPILAYELTQVNQPSLHTRGMLMYGGRIVAGHKLISAEGEYTLGNTEEVYAGLDQRIQTHKQNARLGARSELMVVPGVDFVMRAGGQASQTKVETTTISSGSSVTVNPDWEIHPYAGLGVKAHVFKAITASVEATYLFRSVKDWSQNDVQTALSLKIALPNS